MVNEARIIILLRQLGTQKESGAYRPLKHISFPFVPIHHNLLSKT